MAAEALHDPLGASVTSIASVIVRGGDSVTPVGGTEPRPGWPGEPDEAWSGDPDAYYEEVVGYMKRLRPRCESSDEFVAALEGLFPGLEEKVAKARALAAEDLGDEDIPDPDADIAAGRGVTYPSSAEFLAALMARTADPVRD